jgi:hypothetical protein
MKQKSRSEKDEKKTNAFIHQHQHTLLNFKEIMY